MSKRSSAAAMTYQNPFFGQTAGFRCRPAYLAKTCLDVSAAVAGLIVLLPLLLLVGLLVSLDGGPVLFAHSRIGRGGRSFPCLKFRTMAVNGDQILADYLAGDPAAAAIWAQQRKLANDPRVTRIGRILRKTSLDEMPQLLNVLRREMSLVGPRPIVAAEVPLYGECIVKYYRVRPGLTGAWQVSGRSTTSYERRVALDTQYVDDWSFRNDIAILARTIPAVLKGSGAC